MALRWRTEPLWLSAQRYLEWRHGQTGITWLAIARLFQATQSLFSRSDCIWRLPKHIAGFVGPMIVDDDMTR
jgi:hypothetical protein